MGIKQHAKKKSECVKAGGWTSVLLNTALVHSGAESLWIYLNMDNFLTMLSTKK